MSNNNIVTVTCRRCGESIRLDSAGEHLETCEVSAHVFKAIKAEFDGTERVLTSLANECRFGASEAG